MPPKTAQQPNFLLKITLVKTINPTVARLISVPADLQFNELHLTIAAAFDWDGPCYSWLFRIWTEDPVKYCDSLKHKGNIAIYCTSDDSGASIKPSQLKPQSRLSQQLKGVGSGRFWTYDYDVSRFHHAIEVVDTLNDDQKGTIGCLGGQGQVGRKAWQFADLASVDGVSIGAKSTWDLDMGQLNARLSLVQKRYEERKSSEATKTLAKKSGAKSKTPASEPAKVARSESKAATPVKKSPQSVLTAPAAVPDISTQGAPAKTNTIEPTAAATTAAKSNPPQRTTHAEFTPPTTTTPAKSTPSQATIPTTATSPRIPTTTPLTTPSAEPPTRKPATKSSPHPITARTNPPPAPTNPSIPKQIKSTPPTPVVSPLTPPAEAAAAQSKKRARPTEMPGFLEEMRKRMKVVKSETSVKDEAGVKKERKG